MKRKEILTLLSSVCLVLILAALPFTAACAKPPPAPAPAPTPAQPIVLRAISALPEITLPTQGFLRFVEIVNERAKGELTIKYVGGPDVAAPHDQPMAVKQGVVEMASTFSAAYAGILPGVESFTFSQISLADEREKGVYDFIQPLYNNFGLFLLGRQISGPSGEFFNIMAVKKVEKLADLKGLKIGNFGPVHSRFLETLGASNPIVAPPDLYTALERGVIDGDCIPIHDNVVMGVIEVAKFLIDHAFASDNFTVYLNLETWNGLPKHLQDLLTKAIIDTDREWEHTYMEDWRASREAALKAGVQFVKFSPAEAEQFVKTAYDAGWEDIIERNPELGPKLRELLSK